MIAFGIGLASAFPAAAQAGRDTARVVGNLSAADLFEGEALIPR